MDDVCRRNRLYSAYCVELGHLMKQVVRCAVRAAVPPTPSTLTPNGPLVLSMTSFTRLQTFQTSQGPRWQSHRSLSNTISSPYYGTINNRIRSNTSLLNYHGGEDRRRDRQFARSPTSTIATCIHLLPQLSTSNAFLPHHFYLRLRSHHPPPHTR